MRTSIDCLFSPSRISTSFQFWSERPIAAATCSTVTIEVEDKNQAVPRMPSKSASAFLSSSAKYLVMLTVEWASVEGSTHVAATGELARNRTNRASNQGRKSNSAFDKARRRSPFELASVVKLACPRLTLA